MRGRCIHPGTLPGCLFDQDAGALRPATELHTVSGKNTQKQLDDMTVEKMMILWQIKMNSVSCTIALNTILSDLVAFF